MPQTSPMNWMIIANFFYFLMLVNHSLVGLQSISKEKKLMKIYFKNLLW